MIKKEFIIIFILFYSLAPERGSLGEVKVQPIACNTHFKGLDERRNILQVMVKHFALVLLKFIISVNNKERCFYM
jgi:hypothetical protein